jgi:hypothetical protein
VKIIWKILGLVVLAMVVVLLVAGCGGKPSIVGKWQSTDDANNSIEFTKDGNLIVAVNGHTVTGTYEVLSDDYVKVNVSGVTGLLALLFQKDTWKYIVTKSDLSLSGDKLTRTFKRM